MTTAVLRVLIVEDRPERQEILRSLYREHAWTLVNTAARAIRLVESYTFDLISLDFDLAGDGHGDEVASAIARSANATTEVIVHSMNKPGAQRISAILPRARLVPLSRITRTNATFKRVRLELSAGTGVDWRRVVRGEVAPRVKSG